MPGLNPVIALVNTPVPLPSLVLLSVIVGVWLIPQHTPRDVTGELPSKDISPPLVAAVDDMLVRLEVLSVGRAFGGSFLHENVKDITNSKHNNTGVIGCVFISLD